MFCHVHRCRHAQQPGARVVCSRSKRLAWIPKPQTLKLASLLRHAWAAGPPQPPQDAPTKLHAARAVAEANTQRMSRIANASVRGGLHFGGLAAVFYGVQVRKAAVRVEELWRRFWRAPPGWRSLLRKCMQGAALRAQNQSAALMESQAGLPSWADPGAMPAARCQEWRHAAGVTAVSMWASPNTALSCTLVLLVQMLSGVYRGRRDFLDAAHGGLAAGAAFGYSRKHPTREQAGGAVWAEYSWVLVFLLTLALPCPPLQCTAASNRQPLQPEASS